MHSPSCLETLPRPSGGAPRAIAIKHLAPSETPRLIEFPHNYLLFGKMYFQISTAYTGLDVLILLLTLKAQDDLQDAKHMVTYYVIIYHVLQYMICFG